MYIFLKRFGPGVDRFVVDGDGLPSLETPRFVDLGLLLRSRRALKGFGGLPLGDLARLRDWVASASAALECSWASLSCFKVALASASMEERGSLQSSLFPF